MTGRWSMPLTTERLILTPVVPGDAEVLLAMFREPMVRRYLLDDEPIERGWVDHEIINAGRGGESPSARSVSSQR